MGTVCSGNIVMLTDEGIRATVAESLGSEYALIRQMTTKSKNAIKCLVRIIL